jgi:hypothetical protein
MRVTLRTQKLSLSFATAVCLLGLPTVAYWSAMPLSLAPDHTAPAVPSDGVSKNAGPTADVIRQVASDSRRDIWTKRLRQPLYDAPPPQPVQKTLPPLQVALKGTIVEPGNSMAIIASPDGTIEYKKVGDPLGPPDGVGHLTEIHSDAILVERGDKTETLKVSE